MRHVMFLRSARVLRRVSMRSGRAAIMIVLFAILLVTLGTAGRGAASSSCTLSVEVAKALEVHATRALLFAQGKTASEHVSYTFEYSQDGTHWEQAGESTAEAGDFEGTIGRYAVQTAKARHLHASTSYVGRVIVKNGCATVLKQFDFATGTVGAPEVQEFRINQAEASTAVAVGREYADYQADIESNGVEAKYRFEIAEEEALKQVGESAWKPATGTGTSGAVTAGDDFTEAMVHITGLKAETKYSMRIIAENELGKSQASTTFKTVSPIPVASIDGATGVTDISAHITGKVRPRGSETQWGFEYASSLGKLEKGEGVLAGPKGTIGALEADEGFHQVEGELEGLSAATTYYVRLHADNGHPPAATSTIMSFETAGRPVVLTFATHAFAPGGETLRVLGSVEPHGLDTRFHFEYVTQEAFAASGWAAAASTQERDAGVDPYSGAYPAQIFGADLPSSLAPGRTYRYRLVATNALGSVDGGDQVLTVPIAASGSGSPCDNESARTGLSSHLPDCRAYELVTPPEKEGSMDNWAYSGNVYTPVLVGEEGEKVMVRAQFSSWGSNVDAVDNAYFFTRKEGDGWSMTAATQQPGAAQNSYQSSLFSANLDQIGLTVGFSSSLENVSSNTELVLGMPGGLYTRVASAPRSNRLEWVAASRDLKIAILSNGGKLYEWADGHLGQIDGCPATVAKTAGGGSPGAAVSVDGSRVFFEAPSGSGCAGATHLFMRLDASETIDLGAYRFLAGNAEGTQLLVESQGQPTHEYRAYDTEARTSKILFSTGEPHHVLASSDMSVIYVDSAEQLIPEAPPVSKSSENAGGSPENVYRYDVSEGKLAFVVQTSGGGTSVSANGRYYYWIANGTAAVFSEVGPFGDIEEQVYRYDDVEKVVQCVSCASSFNPAPKLQSHFEETEDVEGSVDNVPGSMVASDNGDYVFFVTAAELVPQDTDGELYAGTKNYFSEEHDFYYSPSSDVYEWRKNGVDGCSLVQGCIALISSGTGGLRNALLGTTPSGRDVFFATHARLTGQDVDGQGDLYDARIGGGFPPKAERVAECEGDACVSPLPAPIDTTPASLSFTGPGNATVTPAIKAITKRKIKSGKKARSRAKVCKGKKGLVRRHGRCVRAGR